MVQQTHTQHKLFGVLLTHAVLSGSALCQSRQVVMTAEIKVHYLLDFTIDHFGDIKVV